MLQKQPHSDSMIDHVHDIAHILSLMYVPYHSVIGYEQYHARDQSCCLSGVVSI